MSFESEIKQSELFIELPEQQQEEISGGSSFDFLFFQQTNILSFASSELNLFDGNLVASFRDQALYQYSQTTLILASFSGGFNLPRNSQSRGSSLLSRFFS
ncbi:MAG: hypothetical protein KME59_07760 [Trichormus sp. ATA11-4-KO1]|jgi:hypothetical protein|nr:hypothetical protein [Trichormus sp. ATA11-4-KO1]